MMWLEAIDHISQAVMALSIIFLGRTYFEQKRVRELEEKKIKLDPRLPTEAE